MAKGNRRTVDVRIQIEPEVYARLVEKFGDVQQVLKLAAEQLAETDEKSIANALKWVEQYQVVHQLLEVVDGIVEDIRKFSRKTYPAPVLDVVARLLMLEVSILYKLRDYLKSMRIPTMYKRKLAELVEALLAPSTSTDYTEYTDYSGSHHAD